MEMSVVSVINRALWHMTLKLEKGLQQILGTSGTSVIGTAKVLCRTRENG